MKKSEIIENKVFTMETIRSILNIWKFQEKKIVFTNGCFDVLHLGHIDYLAKAADMGNILLIGVNSDTSVSAIKGIHRPINNQLTRTNVLASLFFVNGVLVFDEPTPLELIKFIRPDVLVKGADWKKEDIVGYDLVIENGGIVETIGYLEGYSTTALEQKILKSHQ